MKSTSFQPSNKLVWLYSK